MFPFGVFPFNVMPMTGNPWWPIQSKQAQDMMPPMMKAYFETLAAWSAAMGQANPWIAAYNAMLENIEASGRNKPSA